jgi:putative flippase GtrA
VKLGERAERLLRTLFRGRFAKFAAVGMSGVVVNLGVLWLFASLLGVREVVASAIAIEVSIVWNFLLNNAVTYRDRNVYAQADVGGRLLRYNVVSLAGLAIQLGTFVLLRLLVTRGLHRDALGSLRYPAQCAGIALATAWNFTVNLRFTWRQEPDAERAGPRRAPVARAAQG